MTDTVPSHPGPGHDERSDDAGQVAKQPPPSPPVYVQDFGYTPGIEKKRRQARAAWEAKYGDWLSARS